MATEKNATPMKRLWESGIGLMEDQRTAKMLKDTQTVNTSRIVWTTRKVVVGNTTVLRLTRTSVREKTIDVTTSVMSISDTRLSLRTVPNAIGTTALSTGWVHDIILLLAVKPSNRDQHGWERLGLKGVEPKRTSSQSNEVNDGPAGVRLEPLYQTALSVCSRWQRKGDSGTAVLPR